MFGNKLLVVRGFHDAGSALSIGGSIVSGMLSDDSSGDAASAAKKANALNQKMIKDQQNQNNTAYAPYTQAGNYANQLLSQYLGYNPYQTTLDNGGYSLNDLVSLDNNGTFMRNDDLAAISPEYAQAYDNYTNWHKNTFGHIANVNDGTGSYLSDGRQNVLNELNKLGGLDRLNQEATSKSAKFQSNPNFGSLLRGFTANDLNNDVVYNTGLQFGLDEGTKAIDRRAAASGGWDSGSTLKALARYANDYGSQKAGDAYNRFNADKSLTYGILSGQQGTGLNAVNNNQSLNTSLLTGAMNGNTNTANAVGQYGIQGANGLNNAIQGGIGNYLYDQRVNTPINTPVVSVGGLGGGYGYSVPQYSTKVPFYQ